MTPISLSFLLILSLSSTSLSPASALCSPRSSSPYHTLFHAYLPPPPDDDFIPVSVSPSPSPFPSRTLQSPKSSPPPYSSPRASPSSKSAPVPSSSPSSGPLDLVVSSVSQVINTVLSSGGGGGDTSLNAICNTQFMVDQRYPDIKLFCVSTLKSVLKPDDLKSSFTNDYALERLFPFLINQARDVRNKAREIWATDEYQKTKDPTIMEYRDPITTTNRTIGGALSDLKTSAEALKENDAPTLRMDVSYALSAAGRCLELLEGKPGVPKEYVEQVKRLHMLCVVATGMTQELMRTRGYQP